VGDPRKTIYVVLKGKIYDVTLHEWGHYGPEGSYKQFAGKDASCALACMSFDQEFLDDPSIENFTQQQLKTLEEWWVN
jgi:membrane-associated progesterone receptor component